MSTVLGLSVAKDEALGNATEDRDVAKASAEEGLIDGVVDAVVGWLNETNDARTVYNVTMIGLSAARGLAYRTALGAYDVADINRALDASQATQSTNSARNLANAQAERDAVVNRPQSEWSSQAPLAPMSWFGNPFTPEEIAAQQANQYRETMDAWGVTALRTWIADVDAAGVLDEDEAEQSPTSPNPDNNPAENGSSPGDGSQSGAGGNGTGTGTPSDGSGQDANAWDSWVADANAALSPPASDTASSPPATVHTNSAGAAGGAAANGDPSTPEAPHWLEEYRQRLRDTYATGVTWARSLRAYAQGSLEWIRSRPNAQPLTVPNEDRIRQVVVQGRNAQLIVVREIVSAPAYALDAIANTMELGSSFGVNVVDGNTQAIHDQSVALRGSAAALAAEPIAQYGDLFIDAVNQQSQMANGRSLLDIDLTESLREVRRGAYIIDRSAAQGGEQGATLLMLLAGGQNSASSAQPSRLVVSRFADAADEYLAQSLATPSARAAKVRLYTTTAPQNNSLPALLNSGRRTTELADQALLDKLRQRGYTIDQSDEIRRYLDSREANAATFLVRDLLLRSDARKVEVLEEYLHNVQRQIGLADHMTPGELEVHVKEFMLRHRNMLGISDTDAAWIRNWLEISRHQ